jgi:hypothetical protein
MQSDVVLWILGSVIAFCFAVIGFLVKFLFSKAALWGEKLDQVMSDLRLINRELKSFSERADRHDSDISALRSRLHNVNDKLTQIISMFELIRLSSCKDDCPLAAISGRLKEKEGDFYDSNHR